MFDFDADSMGAHGFHQDDADTMDPRAIHIVANENYILIVKQPE